MNQKNKIIVGMSGGVDSSVAALLLIEQGYTVEGLFMKNWEEDDEAGYCAAEVDLADASDVCNNLGIKLHSINFSTEYWDRVFEHFLSEYKAGRTPNPDILCNKEIKFRAFLEHAQDLGAVKIATGHYARSSHDTDTYKLLRGKDTDKDQSYFLHALNQHQLQHSLFPIGNYIKSDIRQLAKDRDMTTYNKKDSTGICFIGERRFDEFLKKYLPATPGDIINTEGEVLGRHSGLMYYTMGQRKGLGIGGRDDSTEEPWYVVDKDISSNQLVIGQGHNHPRMQHQILECSQLNWINGTPDKPISCSAKIRYRQTDQSCYVEQIGADRYQVTFQNKQRAITPGQSVVFYHDDECLGGGVIETMYNTKESRV